MFAAPQSLPHLLPPSAYCSPDAYAQDLAVLRDGWHVIATTGELAAPGDFVTGDIAGVAVQVRNFDGQLQVLSNVCAHRHCLINSQPSGHAAKMRCPYHGWEYQADGRTGRIPQPKNFVPFDKEQLRLPAYRVETVGQLVFVNVGDEPGTLRDWLGEDFHRFLEERFGSGWRLSLKWQPDYPANWKVPIENSLEAYHVPAVHPHTFKLAPDEQESQHQLLSSRTAFGTRLPFSPHSRLDAWFQRCEGLIVRRLGHADTREYWQHHVFPNLLFSFTDAMSLCHCILPTGPRECRAVVRQFGRLPRQGGAIASPLAWLWSRLTAGLNRHILKEDLGIFSAIQRGLERSPHAGVLGRCEERLHAFQCFMQQRQSERHQR